jgi:hypothetical protein
MSRRYGLLPERVMAKRSVAGIQEQMQQRVRVGMLRPGTHLNGE